VKIEAKHNIRYVSLAHRLSWEGNWLAITILHVQIKFETKFSWRNWHFHFFPSENIVMIK